ncbi:MAG: hypothetical protein DI539_03680 [Flavobacterium psychrophilum]|nr:MAG: hypothetical protein DI539_03680 [Flavobacterium psychrophilum]
MNKVLALFAIMVFATSCSTYTVTPESLKAQFLAADPQIDDVKINDPLFHPSKINYSANRIKKIAVTDKQGLTSHLDNSPSIEMRITQKNGKRFVVYFDTVELRNDTLSGSRSRYLGMPKKIPFDSIAKIELQDGGKDYHYQN